jgi:hypothetical protein
MLRRYMGDKPKREYTNSCTPCMALKQQVACNELCCRHFLVMMAQEDLDEGLLAQPPFLDVLKKAPSGHCFYFDEKTTACGAWDKRPLVCRSYDCRDDGFRAPLLREHVNPPEARFVSDEPRTCEGCGAGLSLVMGCAASCDGLAVCIACGAGYSVAFHYAERRFDIRYVADLEPRKRREYLLQSFLYRARWAEALAVLDELLDQTPDREDLRLERAVVLAELGRKDEARLLLEASPVLESALELAWLDRLEGRLDEARSRLEAIFPRLSEGSQVRAMTQLGKVARQQGDVGAAALWFVKGFSLHRKHSRPNAALKEFVMELSRGAPHERAAVQSALAGQDVAPDLRRDVQGE